MIERLPLDLFDDSDEPTGDSVVDSPDSEESAAQDSLTTLDSDVLLVSCQWCSQQFESELANCPHCDAVNIERAPSDPEETTVTCQWCLTVFDSGLMNCPSCDARMVVPGQRVLGEHDVPLDFNQLGVIGQRAHQQQLLAGMMIAGDLSSLAGGLIGIAVSLLDDD